MVEETEPLNPTFERLFVLQFKVLFERLSTEAQDFVRSKIGLNDQSNDIIIKLSKTKFDEQENKKDTLNEIITFVYDYISKLDELYELSSTREVEREVFKSIFHCLNIEDAEIEHLFEEIKRDFDYYPIFKIVDQVIKSGNIFKKYEDYIFEHYLKYYEKDNHRFIPPKGCNQRICKSKYLFFGIN